MENEIVMGIEQIEYVEGSKNVFVIGTMEGEFKFQDAVYVSDFGSDDKKTLLSMVLSTELLPDYNEPGVNYTKILLENAAEYDLKPGNVVYSKDASNNAVHSAYVKALTKVYVRSSKLEMPQEEMDKLSITDCQEILMFIDWYINNLSDDEKNLEGMYKNLHEFYKAITLKKLLEVKEMYYVYSKLTGEANLFSDTYRREGGYVCTPPNVLLITPAYKEQLSKRYDPEKFEIRSCFEKESVKDITHFLGPAFYMNGACGIILNYNVTIAAEGIVGPPDFSDLPEVRRPVMNPDLVRWLLLMGQMGEPKTEDEKLIYSLYVGFFDKEMVNAKLIVPMKTDGELPPGNEEGETTLKKDMTFSIATMPGKYDRDAVKMYTDWKRLYAGMGENEGWSGMIYTVGQMIDTFDIAINATEFITAGCYVDKNHYEDAKKRYSPIEKSADNFDDSVDADIERQKIIDDVLKEQEPKVAKNATEVQEARQNVNVKGLVIGFFGMVAFFAIMSIISRFL